MVTFVIPQTPKGKARHQTVPLLRCGKCQRQVMGHRESCSCGNKQLYFLANTSYTPADQKEYERFAAMCAQQGMNHGNNKFSGPTRVECRFFFAIPKSRQRKLKDGDWHTQRPDTDNCVKSVWDAMNQICFSDDCMVTQMVAEKRWTTGVPRTEVTIILLENGGVRLNE